MLAEHPKGGDLSQFLPNLSADAENLDLRARAAVASTLQAGLELAREGVLTIEQEAHGGPMSFAHQMTEDEAIGGVTGHA